MRSSATVAAIAAYVNGHDICGVTATDPQTLRFSLIQPASDFVNILAMPFASPVPQEYLSYLPDGAAFRQHTISDGPTRSSGHPARQRRIPADRPVRHDAQQGRRGYLQVDVGRGRLPERDHGEGHLSQRRKTTRRWRSRSRPT
jgi:hypothetical protein